MPVPGSKDDLLMLRDIHKIAEALTKIAAALDREPEPEVAMKPPSAITATRRAQMVKGLRRDMYSEMVSVLGSGYVPDYYSQNAEPFVRVAERLADEVARGDWA
jgi:hypothetical protein